MRQLGLAFISILLSSPLLAQNIKASRVHIAEDPKHGLTIVAFDIPKNALMRSGVLDLKRWQVVVPNAALQQVYLANPKRDPHPGKKTKNSLPSPWLTVLAIVKQKKKASIEFYHLQDVAQNPAFTVSLNIKKAKKTSSSLIGNWARARNNYLSNAMRLGAGKSLLKGMLYSSTIAYEGKNANPSRLGRRTRGRQAPDLMSLMTGEAAIQETLQSTVLLRESEGESAKAIEDITKLKTISAKSLQFKKLLGSKKGETLPIATLVPEDRFFVYVSEPGKVFVWLDQISANGMDLLAMAYGRRNQQQLTDRYLGKLHLTRDLVKQLTKLGKVNKIAFFSPDIYWDHGSDFTVILDASQIPLVKSLLTTVLGIANTGNDGVIPYRPPGTAAPYAYYSHYKQWMIFSTHRDEAKKALQLAKNNGQGSLGRSAELRYMLSLLPANNLSKGIYVYFSDPFIRHMLSPQVKIGQLHRAIARAKMQLITHANLLYKIDHGGWPDLKTLQSAGYLSDQQNLTQEGDTGFQLNQGRVSSRHWGSLADMTPLNRLPISVITLAEKKSYETFIENYNRYWSEFFDPIGIRLQIDRPIRVETVILPLVENSIYNSVRDTIGGKAVALSTPGLTPAPVTQLSFKLNNKKTSRALEELVNDFGRQQRIISKPVALSKMLGDAVHFAIYDNNPILTFGSSELLAGFASSSRFNRFELMIPVLLSIFTQPMTVFIDLKDPDGLAQLLSQLPENALRERSWRSSQLHIYRLGQQSNQWLFQYRLFGQIGLKLYVRVMDKYLAISNRQFHFQPAPKPLAASTGHGRMVLHYDRLQQLLPPLYITQVESLNKASFQAIGRLLPMFMAGADTVAEAEILHARLYGYVPKHPAQGHWIWHTRSQRLASSIYGALGSSRLPSYLESAAKTIQGPFDRLKQLDLIMRFRQSGLFVKLLLWPT